MQPARRLVRNLSKLAVLATIAAGLVPLRAPTLINVSFRKVLTAVALVALLASYPTAAPEYADWSAPLNLGPVVNSFFIDIGPAISKDGLDLYFQSNRPGGSGNQDIWVSQRATLDSPWGLPENTGGILNTADIEGAPVLSRDEHWLFFNSNRSGGFGELDIWASYRHHTKDAFGWQPPMNLGAGVNSSAADQGAGYFENDDAGAPLLFFASNRPGGAGGLDIYVSQLLSDGTFGPASSLAELSSPAADSRPSVRFDGLEVFFFSNRPGSLGVDLWVAMRDTLSQVWYSPENLGPVVNSAAADQNPNIAGDRRTLYFASNRPGGFGEFDLYVTTRSKTRGR
jgi:Tol biopolymer transport system component